MADNSVHEHYKGLIGTGKLKQKYRPHPGQRQRGDVAEAFYGASQCDREDYGEGRGYNQDEYATNKEPTTCGLLSTGLVAIWRLFSVSEETEEGEAKETS